MNLFEKLLVYLTFHSRDSKYDGHNNKIQVGLLQLIIVLCTYVYADIFPIYASVKKSCLR